MLYLSGPGHGAPGVLAPTYLDGSYSEVYPDISRDSEGTRASSKSFLPGPHRLPLHPGNPRLDP